MMENQNSTTVFCSEASDHDQIMCSPGSVLSEEKEDEERNKLHKVAFQTKSQVDILDDGYRWRKYGQKFVKNSKFPRNYYKCTQKGCNVKKQIQRSSTDEELVVTTYEGTHTHQIQKCSDSFEQIILMSTHVPPF